MDQNTIVGIVVVVLVLVGGYFFWKSKQKKADVPVVTVSVPTSSYTAPSVTSTAGATVVPGIPANPTSGSGLNLNSVFPNKDALVAYLNDTKLSQGVFLDGVSIHTGFSPSVAFVTNPDGTVSRPSKAVKKA